ncbi:hypothetical protein ACFO0S_11110 [Chryseomicrobium palamuruense]|uniref:DUF4025 domain-containing protein n=1 Tax=Chryseomicrobium palamuruense TaxID=682973 RepID=A0ABV8UY04_9BACL
MAYRTHDTHEVRKAGETTSYNVAQVFYEEMGEKEERMPSSSQNDHSRSDDSDDRKRNKEDVGHRGHSSS